MIRITFSIRQLPSTYTHSYWTHFHFGIAAKIWMFATVRSNTARLHMVQWLVVALSWMGERTSSTLSSKLNVWSDLLAAIVHTKWWFYDDISAGQPFCVAFSHFLVRTHSSYSAIFNVVRWKRLIRSDLCVINIEIGEMIWIQSETDGAQLTWKHMGVSYWLASSGLEINPDAKCHHCEKWSLSCAVPVLMCFDEYVLHQMSRIRMIRRDFRRRVGLVNKM